MRRTQAGIVISVIVILLVLVCGCGASKPVIKSLNPKSGLAGTKFILSGTGFGQKQGKSAVHVGTKTADISSWSETSISASVPGSLSYGNDSVSVVTAAGTSNKVNFSVIKPVTASSPLEAMENYLKSKGIDTTDLTFEVVSVSKTDPNWKVDKASQTGKPTQYFLVHKVSDGWTVVDYGTSFTATKMKANGAPSDLAPPPKSTSSATQ